MTTIRESGFVLKVATGAAIGVTSESALDPANMSSGAATAGQVLTADGAGGASWADDIGPVPVSRQIIDGTGISGGGDLSADRTIAVNQSALDPANMSSGSATSGQLLTAGGGGVVSWADAPSAGVSGPGSSTDDALARWNGASGGILQNSGVTLSDAGAMAFPTGGSISKPSTGANTEAFGLGASAQINDCVAVGNGATIGNSNQSVAIGRSATVAGGASQSTIIGYNSSTGSNAGIATVVGCNVQIPAAKNGVCVLGGSAIASHGYNVAIGYQSKIHPVSSGDSIGAIAIGRLSEIGNATPGAGCDSAIAIGYDATVAVGASNAMAIGPSANNAGPNSIAVGVAADVDNANSIAIGTSAQASDGVAATATGMIAIGNSAKAGASDVVVIGRGAEISTPSSGDNTDAIAIGRQALVDFGGGAGCDGAIAIGGFARVLAGHSNSIAMGAGSTSTASNRVSFATSLEVEIGQGLAVWGVTPPASQPSKINDPSGGATIDAEARTAIQSIIDVLEGAGLSSAT